jgi:hypothetical protein
LTRYPEAKIRVLVLWGPYLQNDNSATAQRATVYLSDRRVTDFWDLWRFGTRTYSKQMNIPVQDAWDMAVFYEPGITWEKEPPKPTFWMQNRNLDHGTPFSKEALEEALQPWLKTK